jgi:hypothetical protein
MGMRVLRVTSYARPGKLFAANRGLIVAQVAMLRPEVLQHVVDAVVKLLQGA